MKIEMCDEFDYRITDENKDIFMDFNTSKENVLRNNKRIKTYKGEWVKVKVNQYISHYVRPAQTLEDIAKQYATSCEKLIADNALNSNKLFIGQMIKIYK